MIRIAALNDSSSDDDDNNSQPEVATKEAQEDEAYTLYNKALQLQHQNDIDKAEVVFQELLTTSFLQDAVQLDEAEGLVRPNLLLKYSSHKNLAQIASKKKNDYKAMKHYLEAISLDSSDVALWFRIGTTALKIHNYPLARLAFQEGLKCNPNHWPCLDHLITVLYALNDYATCLYYISQAFEREPYYTKGFAFRDQIFREHPSLRRDSRELFDSCDDVIYKAEYDKEEGEKFVQESLEMRQIKRELGCLPSPPVLKFTKPWKSFTWECLGDCLIGLYDHIQKSIPLVSFGCRVDIAKYLEPNSLETSPEVCVASDQNDEAGLLVLSDAAVNAMPMTVNNQASGQHTSETAIAMSSLVSQVISENNYMDVDETMGGIDTPTSEGMLMGNRRGQKRKRLSIDFGDALTKRRSARVRNTTVVTKKQDNINYVELLQKFLPSSLLSENTEEERIESSRTPLTLAIDKSGTNGHDMGIDIDYDGESSLRYNEEAEVRNFLESYQKNSGVLELLYKYLIALAEKHNKVWYPGIKELFVSAYNQLREHTNKPSLLCQELENDFIKVDGIYTLVYCELKMDTWNHHRVRTTTVSPPGSCRNYTSSQLGPDFPGKHFREDLEFLVQLTVRRDILGEEWMNFFARVMWLRARFMMLKGQMDFAVDCFERIKTTCFNNEDNPSVITIKVPNCRIDNLITMENVNKQFESLQRCQSLEEVHRLYEAGDYEQVIDLLIPTFNLPQPKNKVDTNRNIPERHAQLLLLQDSLWQQGHVQKCLCYGEMAFNEALQQFSALKEKSAKEDWVTTMCQLLIGLERCLSKDAAILKTLEKSKITRFAQNLIRVIAIQMESQESLSNCINTVHPWIILYRLIEHEESKIRALVPKPTFTDKITTDTNSGAGAENEFGPGVPSSLMLLYNAHEFLGRRSWCCNSDGALLLLYVDVLLLELNRYIDIPHPYREDLETSLEQCFYCLYGHPHKRTKAKHLAEHNSSQITLTWERAVPVFDSFKPKQVPEFDSHKASTVSAELENLLKRIAALIPPQEQAVTVDSVTAYIEGGIEEPPEIPSDKPITIPIVRELYYLLADYYFKNKEFGKAIRFYTMDICFNPDRFDSWAGMALARSSQLEQKLNSCDLKHDGPVYRKSASCLKCFHRALQIDKKNATLWIEYGSVAYMLHALASRQLKQQIQFKLTKETIDMLTTKRSEMLSTAEQCFRSANQCDVDDGNEEEWLHHYMLGKISEKKEKPIDVCLEHYRLAAHHLHEKEARYPRKIQYHNPPYLAMEALEVYYRTHAATLKYLLKHESESLSAELSDKIYYYMKEVAAGPFATFQENSRCASLSSSDVEEPTPPPPSEQTMKPKPSTPVTYDHDYFRRKRMDSSTEESENEPRLRQSVDSSSESLDSATVKEILNSIIAVVLERCPTSSFEKVDKSFVILGDKKIPKPGSPPVATPTTIPNDGFSETTVKVEQQPPEMVNGQADAASNKDEKEGNKAVNLDETTPEVSQSGTSAPISRSDSITEDSDVDLIAPSTKPSTPGQTPNDTKENSLICISSVSNLSRDGKEEATSDKMERSESTEQKGGEKLKIEKETEEKMEVGSVVPSSGTPHVTSTSEQDKNTAESKLDGTANETQKKDEGKTGIKPERKAAHSLVSLIDMCLGAMKQCLQRFPQHYKSLYQLSHYYCYSKVRKNLHWSKDYLLGRNLPWNQMTHMPSQGLFSERKNTNFFNGIWRIPNDDIDRPGSFGSHMSRSILLLTEVLRQLKDYSLLVNLAVQLHRTPDTGKKYLRDMDRLYLAGIVKDLTFTSLKEDMKKFCAPKKGTDNREKAVKHMLTVYRAWHNLIKGIDQDESNQLLEDVYCIFKKDVNKNSPVIEQALKFCQQQLALTKSPKLSGVPSSDGLKSSSPSLLSGISPLDKKTISMLTAEVERKAEENFGSGRWGDASESQVRAKMLADKHELTVVKDKASTAKDGVSVHSLSGAKDLASSKWNANHIPARGMTIGSMTITPVGTPTSSQAEGLMGRLASSRPLSPLGGTKKPSGSNGNATVQGGAGYKSFDPSRLTADVQSKISSLDPVEQATRAAAANMSGFQMEFLRQITQQQPPVPPTKSAARGGGSGRGGSRGANSGLQRSNSYSYGSRSPGTTPTSHDPTAVTKLASASQPVKVSAPSATTQEKSSAGTKDIPHSTAPAPKVPEIATQASDTKLGDDDSKPISPQPPSSPVKPCFVQLRSIRIPTITQEPAKRMPPPSSTKPPPTSKASTASSVSSKNSVADSAVEVITLSSSSSHDDSSVNE